jgi:hypothetical protein
MKLFLMLVLIQKVFVDQELAFIWELALLKVKKLGFMKKFQVVVLVSLGKKETT